MMTTKEFVLSMIEIQEIDWKTPFWIEMADKQDQINRMTNRLNALVAEGSTNER